MGARTGGRLLGWNKQRFSVLGDEKQWQPSFGFV